MGIGRVCGAGFFGDQQRRASRRKEESAGEKERATVVWQGELLHRHRRVSSMVEEGGQLDR